MDFKNFRINIIFRVILLIFSIFLLVKIIDLKHYYVTPIIILILIVLQVVFLIKYVEKTNQYLSNFLQAIRFSDFSTSFKVEGLGTSFDNLTKDFNNVINDFKKIRSEKEEHFFYLQNIIEHIEIAIIVFYEDGTVKISNKAAHDLFQLNNIKNISEIENWNLELKNALENINTVDDKLIKIVNKDDILQLLIHADEFIIHQQKVKLVSLKNIQTELEEQEMEAWQKLIRVLTHEIMNSIAPISSLSNTINVMFKDVINENRNYFPENFDFEIVNDINQALTTIHKRSTGLIHFVETYRNLTKIPNPNFSIFQIKPQLDYIKTLFENELSNQNIDFEIIVVPENIKITADEQLIEQVLINLIKNSIQSFGDIKNKKIQLKSFIDNKGRKLLQIKDNGQGIMPEVIEKIFIPFFTTKQTGSGIGLSLSRQIMRLHGGSISVFSEQDEGTIFTLNFN